MKPDKAPILSVNNYASKLSRGSLHWKNFRYHYSDVFHINKMEDYIRLTNLEELPLPPHRKDVFDFIFLTRGKLIRSKGLDTYEISAHQFFFLPAYQFTTMQSLSADATDIFVISIRISFIKNFFRRNCFSNFHFFILPVTLLLKQIRKQ